MAIENVRGIVIKEMNKGETSKNLIVMAKEKGKIFMTSKGSRKHKSNLMAISQMFCYCDFIAYTTGNTNKKYYNITQGEVIHNFYNIRVDIEKLAYSTYIMELVDKTCFENIECDDVIFLMIKTFYNMSKENVDSKFIAIVFQIKYMVIMGFMPQVYNCVFCGNENNITYFSNAGGGIMCDECAKKLNGIKVSSGTIKALKYIIESDISNVFMFRVSEYVLNELFSISKEYILTHLNTNFKTLDFVDSLNNM